LARCQVISKGVDADKKLLGSKRARAAVSIIVKTPRDKERLLGSQRLRAARDILFAGVTLDEDKKMFGSRRLAGARTVLVGGAPVKVPEITKTHAALAAVVEVVPKVDEEKQEADDELAVPAEKKPLQFGGVIASDMMIQQISEIRTQIAEITDDERSTMTAWVDELLDEDILR